MFYDLNVPWPIQRTVGAAPTKKNKKGGQASAAKEATKLECVDPLVTLSSEEQQRVQGLACELKTRMYATETS